MTKTTVRKTASFRAMDDAVPEDWQLVTQGVPEFMAGLPDRVLTHMQLLTEDHGGLAVSRTVDLREGSPALPPTDDVAFWLGDVASPTGRVVVRPSGTEPKLKAYLEAVVPVASSVADARAVAGERLAAMRADLQRITGLR